MSKSRMIGIKISDKSNLNERLRALSKRAEMDYAELLEKWVSAEEKNYGSNSLEQLPLFPEEEHNTEQLNYDEFNHGKGYTTEFEEITARIVKLESQIKFNEELNQTAAATPQTPNIDARIGAMEKTIAELTVKLEAVNSPAQPIEDIGTHLQPAAENKPHKAVSKTAPERELKTFEIRIIELSKMTNEAGKKLTTRAIAERLEAEGVLSEKGLSKWSSGNVSDHQKKLRDRRLLDG